MLSTTMEKLVRPPIIEAQIGFKLSKTMELLELSACADLLLELYPQKKPRVHLHATIRADGDKIDQQETVVTQEGFQLSRDGFAIIFQQELLIFCALGPYPGWENFKKEVDAALKLLNEKIPSFRIQEIFLRFINGIKLELPISLNDYFTFLPALPIMEPVLTLNGLNYQFSSSQADTGFNLSASFFPRPHYGESDSAEFMLDLSVSKQLSTIGIDSQVWDNLLKARTLKNALFDSLVTAKLKGKYL